MSISADEHDCPCPNCDTPGTWLEASSRIAQVDYYRCASCTHTWWVPKHHCEPHQDVTV
jgi:hypothetical protein